MVILVDATCICHIVKHSIKGLKWREQETGVIFGFMGHIFRLAKKFDSNKFVFAWDSRKSLRRQEYPPYKQERKTRDKSPEELRFDDITYNQFNLTRREVLPKLGFKNSYIQTGLEADDIIARIVLDNRNVNFMMVSTDKDLYQLLNDHCALYSPRSKSVYTSLDFKEEWGIPPYQWATVLAIAGCNTDEVQGVDGVGLKTAAKYLRGELKGSLKACKAINSEEGKVMATRNERLVKLPFPNTQPIPLQNFNGLKTSDFLDVFHRFGFQSFLKHEEFVRWRKLMKMS